MPRSKKIELAPKSTLGLDSKLYICYNCMFWQKATGYCPWCNKENNYNCKCINKKFFRYDFKNINFKQWKNLV